MTKLADARLGRSRFVWGAALLAANAVLFAFLGVYEPFTLWLSSMMIPVGLFSWWAGPRAGAFKVAGVALHLVSGLVGGWLSFWALGAWFVW